VSTTGNQAYPGQPSTTVDTVAGSGKMTRGQQRRAKRRAKQQAEDEALAQRQAKEYGKKWILNPAHRWWSVRATAEIGFVGVLYNRIQSGMDGTPFDYRNEGGQDALFPWLRFTGEWEAKRHHTFIFLVQPLNVTSDVTFRNDHRIDGIDFPAGTSVDVRYDFSFYRFSYLYDFFRDPEQELAIGVSGQLRNAVINFTATDGSRRSGSRGLGFVPVLKVRGRYTFPKGKGLWLGGEIDGFYAKGRGVSGSPNYFEGAILDASARVGLVMRPVGDIFVNLRYLGGGARGTDEGDLDYDGYTSNWLHTMTFSLGIQLR